MKPAAARSWFVHPQALCECEDVGADTRLWAFSHVMAGARVGAGCNLGEHVFVESGSVVGAGCTIKNGVALWDRVTLEDDVFVGPYVVFTNDLRPRAFIKRGSGLFLPTLIRRGATLGANATIVCGVTVGEYAMVGAGAVVTRDVPAHALVVGNPAKPAGRVCFCGEKLNRRGVCGACGVALAKNAVRER